MPPNDTTQDTIRQLMQSQMEQTKKLCEIEVAIARIEARQEATDKADSSKVTDYRYIGQTAFAFIALLLSVAAIFFKK